MKTLTVLMALWLSPASAADMPSAAPAAEAAKPAQEGYGYGMEQRRAGDHAGAKKTFLEMLMKDPASNGALEGLSLSCIALGQYEEALVYLKQWLSQSPGSAYILRLMLRAQGSVRDDKAALLTCREMAALDPRDCAMRARAESLAERADEAVFPAGRVSRTLSIEGLDTASPQRIIYEGTSASARFRHGLTGNLNLIGGAVIRQEAQRNDGRGFTYYDILEKTYSAGLERNYGLSRGWEAEYGRSFLSDREGNGVGSREKNRLRFHGYTRWRGADLRLWLDSRHRYLRVSGGSSYFRLLRDNSARGEAETTSGAWNLLARAGVTDTSDGTTLPSYSLRGGRELGKYYLTSSYSHSQQEFYSGSAEGRLRYVNYDRLGLGLRRQETERYRAEASAYGTSYSDANSLVEVAAGLTLWLPRNREFYGAYRFSYRDFGHSASGYDSVDDMGHWLGAYWRRCRGHNWSALAGYERGFITDKLVSYGAEVYLAELDWYAGRSGAVSLQGRRKTTSGRGHSYSLGLQARISFK